MAKTSALDALIKVKKAAKSDDLIAFMDEVIAYEKLSKIEAFKDLRNSEAAKKKLPLLAGAYQGDIYALTLLDMVRNIIAHLTEQVPDILTGVGDKEQTKREQHQLEIVKKSVVDVFYYSLGEYEHTVMKENVIAVFTEEHQKQTAALIITKSNDNRYNIYQGYYEEKEEEVTIEESTPFVCERDGSVLTITTYSVTGNNAYPFGTLRQKEKEYAVMMPEYNKIWLIPETGEVETILLTREEINELNMAKSQINNFASCLLTIIRKDRTL